MLDEFEARGAQLYGVSCDATWSLRAFREKLGVTIPMLSDFEPKGETCRAFGVYHPGGFPKRALVHRRPRRDRHSGATRPTTRATCPGANLIFDGLAAEAGPAMTDLGSAPLPPLAADDHVRGPAERAAGRRLRRLRVPLLRCCAHARLDRRPLRRVFRHFPVRSKHPRAWAAACAAEAAGRQGPLLGDARRLYADQGRLEDPHLWARAERAGPRRRPLRRRPALGGGARARPARLRRGRSAPGSSTTPTLFVDGRRERCALGRPARYDGGDRIEEMRKIARRPTEGGQERNTWQK